LFLSKLLRFREKFKISAVNAAAVETALPDPVQSFEDAPFTRTNGKPQERWNDLSVFGG
jgi:hypothetical protein